MADLDPEIQRLSERPCKSCGARVIWCMTERNRAMPVDVAKAYGGNIELDEGDGAFMARVVRPAEDVERWVSHFVTCPQAAEHRKPAAATQPETEANPNRVLMTFGKHRGEMLGDIPGRYLKWLLENAEIREPALRRAIERVVHGGND